MARKTVLCFLCIIFIIGFAILEAYPASKEIIRLQADVTLLQQQLRDLQKSFDSQGAVLKTLVEQLSDQIAGLKKSMEEVKGSNQQTQAAVSARIDSISGQFSSLNSGLDVVLDKISKQCGEGEQIRLYRKLKISISISIIDCDSADDHIEDFCNKHNSGPPKYFLSNNNRNQTLE